SSRPMRLRADPSPSVSPRWPLRAATPSGEAAATRLSASHWRGGLMKKIADAGLLIGFLDRLAKAHRGAANIFENESPPFYPAEPVVTEVAAVLGSADDVLRMVEVGDLVLALDLREEVSAIRAMVQKYKDRPMDLGDACCVRLSELITGSV